MVPLPFVHSGKAELRLRIEKIVPTTNASSVLEPRGWTDRSRPTAGALATSTPPGYGTVDGVADADVTNDPVVAVVSSSLDSAADMKEADNLTVRITLRKFDYGNDYRPVPGQKAPSGNAEVGGPDGTGSILGSGSIEDVFRNSERASRTPASEESAGEDTKSRAKRNQAVASSRSRRLRGDARATGTRRDVPKDAAGCPSCDRRERKARYGRTRGNRAARSIEEIKALAEKLIAKVSNSRHFSLFRTSIN